MTTETRRYIEVPGGPRLLATRRIDECRVIAIARGAAQAYVAQRERNKAVGLAFVGVPPAGSGRESTLRQARNCLSHQR